MVPGVFRWSTSRNLPSPRIVATRVCDASGRRVLRLFEGDLDAGDLTLAWNGRDEQGRPAAAGAYLVRISTKAGSTTGRLVVLR